MHCPPKLSKPLSETQSHFHVLFNGVYWNVSLRNFAVFYCSLFYGHSNKIIIPSHLPLYESTDDVAAKHRGGIDVDISCRTLHTKTLNPSPRAKRPAIMPIQVPGLAEAMAKVYPVNQVSVAELGTDTVSRPRWQTRKLQQLTKHNRPS